MKLVNIIGLVFVIVAFGVIGYYVIEISDASRSYWNNYDFNSYNSYSYPNYSSITSEAALVMMLFTLFFIFGYIGNMVKVKTTTTRVLTIIGLSFSLLIVLFNLLVIEGPGRMSFDESGGIFLIYHVINLAFFIVLLVQSIRYENRNKSTVSANDIIDSEIV